MRNAVLLLLTVGALPAAMVLLARAGAGVGVTWAMLVGLALVVIGVLLVRPAAGEVKGRGTTVSERSRTLEAAE